MNGLPETYFVRRKDVLGAQVGITAHDFRKAVESGALKGVKLPGKNYSKYRRTEILEVFKMNP